jgi:phenol 2-monooxygenase
MAQGMNTGVHDAVNLSWKLAGVLKGYLKREVLQTYESERRATAQQLINFDRAYSSLITGEVPSELQSRGLEANDILSKYFEEGVQFNIGLGIHYDCNAVNRNPTAGTIMAGYRMPDISVYKPGSRLPTRLHEVIRSRNEFHVLVFVGGPSLTKASNDGVQKVREVFGEAGATLMQSTSIPLKQSTIIAGNKQSSQRALGMPPFGYAYYDHDSSAHMRYGMALEAGGIIVSRPDGIAGFACRLAEAANVLAYFKDLQA